MDRHVVGLTEEKTDEQRDIKTKHKQGRHTYYIYCHADIYLIVRVAKVLTLEAYNKIFWPMCRWGRGNVVEKWS